MACSGLSWDLAKDALRDLVALSSIGTSTCVLGGIFCPVNLSTWCWGAHDNIGAAPSLRLIPKGEKPDACPGRCSLFVAARMQGAS